MTSLKSKLATTLAAATIATGGLTAVAAPAQAAPAGGIAAGNYWYEAFAYGFIPSGRAPATVRNGKLTIYGGFGAKNTRRIHATPRGAFVDQDGFQRHVYKKTGPRSYYATVKLGAVDVGHSTLKPRR